MIVLLLIFSLMYARNVFSFTELFYFIQSDLIISKFPYRFNEITHLLINQSNVEVTWPALGLSDREPRRYVLPFLYEKIITYWRNGKTCNELRAKYGCAFSEALRSKPEENSQPFERYSCVARIRKRIADWSELSTR